MKFYKVKPEADGVRRWKWKNGYIQCYGEFVGSELITEKELRGEVYHGKTKEQIMELVTVPKKETYYFFGIRFQFDDKEEF